MFFKCAENVDKFSARFCPSPISHKKLAFIQISASLQGTCSPHCAIILHKATVFSVTVFPPVLGPVIMTPVICSSSQFSPIVKFNGTQTDFSINGCLASFNTILRSVLISGRTPSYSILSFALENAKSSFSTVAILCIISSATSNTQSVNA